jgi:hypothetical protein
VNLNFNKLHLGKRVGFGVAVSNTLVMLAAIVNPNMLRDSLCAVLVSAEKVRNRFAELRASVAVFDKHAASLCFKSHLYRSTGVLGNWSRAL